MPEVVVDARGAKAEDQVVEPTQVNLVSSTKWDVVRSSQRQGVQPGVQGVQAVAVAASTHALLAHHPQMDVLAKNHPDLHKHLMEKYDANHDGNFSTEEVGNMINDIMNLKKETKQFKIIGAGLFGLLAVSIVSNFAVGLAANEASKESKVRDGAALSDLHGNVVKTSPAKVALPLFVAPVLSAERLSDIDSMSVTLPYDDGASASGRRLQAGDGTIAVCTHRTLYPPRGRRSRTATTRGDATPPICPSPARLTRLTPHTPTHTSPPHPLAPSRAPCRARRCTCAWPRPSRTTRPPSSSTRRAASRWTSMLKTRPVWPQDQPGLHAADWPRMAEACGGSGPESPPLRVPPGGGSGRTERRLVFNTGARRQRRDVPRGQRRRHAHRRLRGRRELLRAVRAPQPRFITALRPSPLASRHFASRLSPLPSPATLTPPIHTHHRHRTEARGRLTRLTVGSPHRRLHRGPCRYVDGAEEAEELLAEADVALAAAGFTYRRLRALEECAAHDSWGSSPSGVAPSPVPSPVPSPMPWGVGQGGDGAWPSPSPWPSPGGDWLDGDWGDWSAESGGGWSGDGGGTYSGSDGNGGDGGGTYSGLDGNGGDGGGTYSGSDGGDWDSDAAGTYTQQGGGSEWGAYGR